MEWVGVGLKVICMTVQHPATARPLSLWTLSSYSDQQDIEHSGHRLTSTLTRLSPYHPPAHLLGLRLAEVLEAHAVDDDLRLGRQVVLAVRVGAHLTPEQQAARRLLVQPL